MKTIRSYLALAVAMLLLFATSGLATAQSTMEALKERGTLRIGVVQTPPWFSKDPRTGEWTGLGVSIGTQLAADLGVKPELVEVTWATAVAALQADKIDIQFVMDATPERAKVVDFPEHPLLYISLALLTDGVSAESWSDLNNPDFSVAVPQSTSMDQFLTANMPEAVIQRFPDNAAAIAAFQSGRVKGLSLYYPPLLAAQQKLQRGEIILPKPVHSSPTNSAVRQEEDKTFVNRVDELLFGYYSSGQTQGWYEDALTRLGLDPKKAPPVQLADQD